MQGETLKKKVDKFSRENPELVKTLELFRISNEQYKSALLNLYKPKTTVSNSTDKGLNHQESPR